MPLALPLALALLCSASVPLLLIISTTAQLKLITAGMAWSIYNELVLRNKKLRKIKRRRRRRMVVVVSACLLWTGFYRTDCWMCLMCQWVGGCGGCHWVPSLVCAIKNRTKRNKKSVEFFVFLLIRPQMQWLLHYVGHWMATSSRCSCTIAPLHHRLLLHLQLRTTDYGLRPGQLMHRSIHPSIAIHLITKQNKTKGRKKERKKERRAFASSFLSSSSSFGLLFRFVFGDLRYFNGLSLHSVH